MAAGRPLTNTTTTGVPVPWTASTSSSCAPGSRNRGAKVGFGTLEYTAALGVMNLDLGLQQNAVILEQHDRLAGDLTGQLAWSRGDSFPATHADGFVIEQRAQVCTVRSL